MFRSVKKWRESRNNEDAPQVYEDPELDALLDEADVWWNEPTSTDLHEAWITSGEHPDLVPVAPKAKTKTTVGKIQVYEDGGGKWRWRMVSTNGRKFAVSGESFASKYNAKRAATRLSETFVDMSVASVEILED